MGARRAFRRGGRDLFRLIIGLVPAFALFGTDYTDMNKTRALRLAESD